MADKISQRFLMVMIAVMTIICGIKPALLSHVILVAGLLLVFIWRDVRGKFAPTNPVTTILLGLVIAWAAASLQWTLLPARGMYDLLLLTILSVLALQIPSGVAHLAPGEADKALKMFIGFSLVSILIFLMDVHFNLIWQRTLNGINWSAEWPMAAISRSGFCLVLLFWSIACYACRRNMHLWVFFLWLVVGASLMMTNSAAGRLSFAVGTVIFLIASRWPQFIRIAMAAVLVAGLGMAIPAAEAVQGLMEGSNHKINNSFLHRGEIWRFTSERIKEKP
ncbi:MAG TPA: hypothetical protein PKW15_07530, partial [Alphaproteobacteria bacterium]|nr:hypothetical protein [Alphaproteobacteria bacterium]